MWWKKPEAHGTTVVVIDALKDFIDPQGTFGKRFATLNGEEDLRPFQEVMPRIERMVRGTHFVAKNIFVSSCFRDEKKRRFLSLCGRRRPVEPDSRPAVRMTDFSSFLAKEDDYLLHSKEAVRVIKECTRVVIAGVTTTTCVKNAVEGCIEGKRSGLFPHLDSIIVPRDVVAARKAREQEASRLFKQWEKDGVAVIPSWHDIPWDPAEVETDVIWTPKSGVREGILVDLSLAISIGEAAGKTALQEEALLQLYRPKSCP
jgi:nicotinamidase-related amidase